MKDHNFPTCETCNRCNSLWNVVFRIPDRGGDYLQVCDQCLLDLDNCTPEDWIAAEDGGGKLLWIRSGKTQQDVLNAVKDELAHTQRKYNNMLTNILRELYDEAVKKQQEGRVVPAVVDK
jgi:hypothetical protein